MYALLPWPGRKVWRLPSESSTSTVPKGEPLAKMHLPSVHSYASEAVHSALEVGLLSAKMSGLAWVSAMNSQISLVKVLGTALTPMMTEGLSTCTACSREVTGSPSLISHSVPLRCSSLSAERSWAKSSLWCASLVRLLVTRPLLSTSQMRLRASSVVILPPLSSWMACAMRLAMPVPASPAPRNTKVWSASFSAPPLTLAVSGREARTPARVTEAVPWMSSLKVV
mmetsp:Transcript_23420/g.66595  ORF Transcript_23420/g.66595 Transcript_23420/m.66595 type:complete len:226 (-) Transcript_23420:792-1469(-)